jgi:hypothetical protein
LGRIGIILGALVVLWFVTAYLFMPAWWRHHAREHPALVDLPNITHTKNGIPGDPLNVALIGAEEEVVTALLNAGWYPADPLTVKSCLKIAAASVFKRPYEDAPVSNLFLWGRQQDLAFQQPVGDSPRQRHHVHFWRAQRRDEAGRPLWIGAGTFDRSVGLSHTTGQITHHIAKDIDTERDHLFSTLTDSGGLVDADFVPDFHVVRTGKNGGGDPWETDGRLRVGIVVSK